MPPPAVCVIRTRMTKPITIERLGHQGDGIAPGPVFAPLTLPGEEVTGTIVGDRLVDVRIVTPSAERVSPPCRHFKTCGGCAMQHAAPDFVEEWKSNIVVQSLAAHGIDAEIGSVHTSPPLSRRRATFSARRTKKGALVGFHARASDVVVAIPDCQLLHPDLMRSMAVAQALAVACGSRKGELSVQATLSIAGLDIAVRNGKPLDEPLQMELAQLASQLDLARLSWEGEIVATRHPPEQVFGSARVTPPPGAFLQATQDGEARILAAVSTLLKGKSRIVDLFAGCGTFALPLAQSAEVHAVEGDAAMMSALDRGWRHASGLKKVTHEARDLFRRPLLADELSVFDAAIIDPPRAGAAAQIREIAAARVPLIAHVSCNPISFARDAATLIAAGYTMGPIDVIDQFRWSSHVELVAGFSLTSA